MANFVVGVTLSVEAFPRLTASFPRRLEVLSTRSSFLRLVASIAGATHHPRTAYRLIARPQWAADEHRRRRCIGKARWPLVCFVGPSCRMAHGLHSR